MKHSPEFRDARVVVAGAPGSGRFELLHAIAVRCGGGEPESLDAWLGISGGGVPRVASRSMAPDGPGGSFDQLVRLLVERRVAP